jgi:glycosyltransferase involved in cell wall biosynthesis
MRVLAFTGLYPTQTRPHYAGFMPPRLAALAQHCEVTLLLPQPTFPGARLLGRAPGVPIDPGPAVRLAPVAYRAWPGLGRAERPQQILATAWPAARRLHRETPFDLILAHFLWPDGVAAAALARELGLPLVLEAHGSDVYQFAAEMRYRSRIAISLAQARGLIVSSAPLLAELERLSLLQPSPLVLPSGYDPARFAPCDAAEARAELGLGPGPWLVFAGALRPVKRVDLLLAALARLPQGRLAIVGDGELRRPLAALAKRLGVAERVRWAGARPQAEVARWLAAADVVVLASEHEGTPTVLVEALALGRPVAATDVGGIRDLVGPAARLAPPRETEALAAAIAATLADPPPPEVWLARAAGRTWAEVGGREAAYLQDRLGARL